MAEEEGECWRVDCSIYSLVPSPFPPPVEVYNYANTVVEGLGDLVTCGAMR